MKSKISFRAIDFDNSVGILLLQEASGGSVTVLVRHVLLPSASFGLELPVPMLGSSFSVDLYRSWSRLVSDLGRPRDDVVGAFTIVSYGSLVAMLLLPIFKGDAASIGVSALRILLAFLLYC